MIKLAIYDAQGDVIHVTRDEAVTLIEDLSGWLGIFGGDDISVYDEDHGKDGEDLEEGT